MVSARAKKIGIKSYQNVENKGSFREFFKENNISKDETLFLGNDINDISAYKKVGIRVAVLDAFPELDSFIDFKTSKKVAKEQLEKSAIWLFIIIILMNKFVCLIPARGNSKRIKNKNIKNLKGHPLIAYTIDAALESKLFHEIVCVTDKSEYKQIAEYYGAKVPRLRPKHTATSKSPDIEWVKWILEILDDEFDAFCILRPTSPS